MQRILKIIVVAFPVFLGFSSNAQQERVSLPLGYHLEDSVRVFSVTKKKPENLVKKPQDIPSTRGVLFPNATVSADWVTRQWGVFCIGEWKFEKATGIPLRIRMGSLEHTDYLEGKRK